MNVLVACEESQVVCKAFREKGHNAFSCDILPTSGVHPEWHIMADVLRLVDGNCCFFTMDDQFHHIQGAWDLIIAHPPCTYLTVTGNRWYNVSRYGTDAIKRLMHRDHAVQFFLKIANADCPRIAIENPVSIMSSRYRKPDQIIQPWMFGDPFEKRTCLWLKGLDPLLPTHIVEPPPRLRFASGKTMPSWYADLWSLPSNLRSRMRSKTFPGIASAMSEQWGDL